MPKKKDYSDQEVNKKSSIQEPIAIYQKPPCQFTLEELKEEIRLSLKDIEDGNLIDNKDLPAKYPEWELE